MAKAICREPGAAQPWQRASLRPAPPRGGATTLAALVGDGTPLTSEVGTDSRGEGVRSEAERLLEEAREDAEQLRAAAAREGYAEGQVRGMQEGAEERHCLRALIGGISTAYHDFCFGQAEALAGLAVAAAEKLLGEQLALEPQRVLAIVHQALEQVAGFAPVTLHLNPADLELVHADLMNDPRRGANAQLVPDPGVERGGCRIESEHGEVDATVSGRLARLRDGLRNEE